MTLWLLAVTPTVCAVAHKRTDHARTCVGFASSWRPLHRKHALIKRERRAHRSCQRRLAELALTPARADVEQL